jgi:glutamate N-acetyltransferase/amino-acid N-acetyltransferase
VSITRPLGFRAAAVKAGIKPSGKTDLTLIVRDVNGEVTGRASSAAVFTSSAVVGAPVEIGRTWRASLAHGGKPLRALLINAGNANAATGRPGVRDALACMQEAAAALGCDPEEILPSSTGVIGRRLPAGKIKAAIPGLVSKLARGRDADDAAAAAIMTTDLVPKTAHREIEIGGHTLHIGAIAKGSGMIAPRLDRSPPPPPHATMLAFLTTDAPVEPALLQAMLEECCSVSFERISVDAHPSCSDTVVVMSSGLAGIDTIRPGSPAAHAFAAALRSVCEQLAEQVVRDGEGATKIFRARVRGARSDADAAAMARAIVDSPLVKCAIHGKDPNWGRIVTAAGNAGVSFDPARASLTIGGVKVYEAGVPTGVAPDDARLAAAMEADPVELLLTVGTGGGAAWFLGCDLSAEYVKINALYTT